MKYTFEKDVTTVTKEKFSVDCGIHYLKIKEDDCTYFKLEIEEKEKWPNINWEKIYIGYEDISYRKYSDIELPYIIIKFFAGDEDIKGEVITEEEYKKVRNDFINLFEI